MSDAAAARPARLQVGFGLGHAFLQAWHAWREASDRPARLDFIALTPSPPDAAALRRAHAGTAWQPLAESLAAQWPPLTRNLHCLAFDDGRVHLLLAVGEPLALLPELRATVDDFFIDELALSGLLPMLQGRQDADDAEHRCQHIRHGNADPNWRRAVSGT